MVESFRGIDRLRLAGALRLESAAARRSTLTGWLESIDLVLLQRPILARASEPFPTPLGTLDALHVSTALVLRERTLQDVMLAPMIGGWRWVARSFGFEVVGA